MKITKARLKQILKEELLKEMKSAEHQQFTKKVLKVIKDNPGKSITAPLVKASGIFSFDGEDLTGAIQNLLRDKKIEKREDGYAIKESIKQIVKEQLLKEFGYDDGPMYSEPELPKDQKEIDNLIDDFFDNKVGIDAVIEQIKATKAAETPSVRSYMLETFEVLLKNLELEDRNRLEDALIEYGIRPEAL